MAGGKHSWLGAKSGRCESGEVSNGGNEGLAIIEEGMSERAEAAKVVNSEREQVDALRVEFVGRCVAKFGFDARQVCFGGKMSCV